MFCQKCGGKIESYANNCAFCGSPVPKYEDKVSYVKTEKKDVEKKGLTTWRWVGFYFLPVIPVIGLIIQIVLIFKWAFGKHDDVTLKGFARSQLLFVLFSIILFIGLFALLMSMPELLESLLKQAELKV